MENDEITLENTCADLVSLKKWEKFPRHVLNVPAGEWVAVSSVGMQVDGQPFEVGPNLFVTWLPDPAQVQGYVAILFYDADSGWCMAAHYNRQRLFAESYDSVPGVKQVAKVAVE
jgi:hypothetical protein